MEIQVTVKGDNPAQLGAQLAAVAARLQGATAAGPAMPAPEPVEAKAGATAKEPAPVVEAKAEPKKRGRKKAEPVAAAKTEAAGFDDDGFGGDGETENAVTFEEMRDAVAALSQRKNSSAQARAIVEEIAGVKRIQDIPAALYAAVKEACDNA